MRFVLLIFQIFQENFFERFFISFIIRILLLYNSKQANTTFLDAVKAIYDNQNIQQKLDYKFTESLQVGLWNNQTILKSSSQDFITWLSTRGTIS